MSYKRALHPAIDIRLLEQLVESLELTLSYYKHSPKALMALHNTVFHNTIRNQGNANECLLKRHLLTLSYV